MKSKRRKFLRNISLASLGISLSPNIAKTNTSSQREESMMCDPTTLDFYGQGPFYTENPPLLSDNKLASPEEPGTRLIVSGRVYNLDCSEFIPDTRIDVWHANDAGQYDNSGFNLRGFVLSNQQGFYMFETILPGKYLNGNQFRPSHIHFKITPPNFPELTTQLYFEGDESIPADAAASITSGQFDATHRTIALTENEQGTLEGTWDIVVDGVGTTNTNDLHLNKGIVYSASPNPFSSQIEILYGVFQKSKVSLLVFDLEGRMVANIKEEIHTPEKYTAVWQPSAYLPSGHYFIAIKINDIQVHYLKVLKK